MENDLLTNLPRRQREVIAHVIAGLTNEEIAYALGISRRTVETHRFKAMQKLGFKRLQDLLCAYYAGGEEIHSAHHDSRGAGNSAGARALRAGAILQHGA